MRFLSNVWSRIRTIGKSLLGYNNNRRPRSVHLVRNEEEPTERQKISTIARSLLGLSRGQRIEVREASFEDEEFVSRVRELKAREQEAKAECTKWLLKAQRALYANGVERPGKSYSDPQCEEDNEGKDSKGSSEAD